MTTVRNDLGTAMPEPGRSNPLAALAGAAQHQRERRRVPERSDVKTDAMVAGTGRAGRGPAILAWAACAVAVGGLVAGAILSEVMGTSSPDESFAEGVALIVGFAALPVMGALVASRHPRNAVGWLFVCVGLGVGILVISTEYAHWALVDQSGSYPGATLAAWFEQWLWYPSTGILLTLILLLFPNGKPPSPRWKWLVWVCVAALGVISLGGMVEERLEGGDYSIDNPIGIHGLGDVETVFGPVFLVLGVSAILCAVSLVVRFRRSRGDERQQLKLLTFAACLMIVGTVVVDLFEIPGTFAITLVVLAGSLAASMLKYRLYDIDRIINKTVVFGLLTAVLLAGYAALVLVLQSVLPVPDDSALTVAGSTLAMAALFGPLRRRIQAIVDRRFYRSKYDAIRTIEVFESSLRRRTDLDDLTSELVEAVRRTVHPSHVSVLLEDRGRTPL
jgi:hypothetical protein